LLKTQKNENIEKLIQKGVQDKIWYFRTMPDVPL